MFCHAQLPYPSAAAPYKNPCPFAVALIASLFPAYVALAGPNFSYCWLHGYPTFSTIQYLKPRLYLLVDSGIHSQRPMMQLALVYPGHT